MKVPNPPYKKILLTKLRALGDTLIATATLESLRQSFPNSEIHFLIHESWRDLFLDDPRIHKLWTLPPQSTLGQKVKRLSFLTWNLRRENFDLVINLHASPSSALVSRLTGCSTRAIHFHDLEKENRHSTVVVPGKGNVKPAIERDLDTLRGLNLEVTSSKTRVHLSQAQTERAKDWIQKENLKLPILSLGIGASRPTKIWPLDRFAEVSKKWMNEQKGSVFAFFSKEENELHDEFKAYFKEKETSIFFFKGLPLTEVAAFIKRSHVFLGNDSGLKHLAISLDIRTLTFFGPEDPFEWHPYSKKEHPFFYVENLSCRKSAASGMPPWCGLNVCEIENHRCMKLIETDEVYQKLSESIRDLKELNS